MSIKTENKIEKKPQKIIPFLWFDNNAEEAINFYTSCFENSKIKERSYYDEASAKASGKKKGTLLTASFQLNSQELIALNGGPIYKFTPATSFMVNCKTEQEIDTLWKAFSNGGTALMELNAYPFSKKFGWIQDRFGLSWQLNFTDSEQKIFPFLMFTGTKKGKAEEAMKFYTSLFKHGFIKELISYESGESGEEGKIKHATFSLAQEDFMAADSNYEHEFSFTPAVSFLVYCENQEEIDFYWNSLTLGGKEKECGWLEDKFGISWQIVPKILSGLLNHRDPQKAKRAMMAMLKMKKLDIETLEQA